MSGDFNVAADAWITMTAGSAGAVGTGAYTMAVLVRPTTGNNNCGMVQGRTASAAVRSLFEDGLKIFGDNDFSAGYGSLTQGNWYVVAQTKPAGSALYRHHVWAYASDGSGTMSHGVTTGTHGDGSAITQTRIGQAVDRGNGLIAVVGLWTSELSDANLDTLKSANLSAWSALSPAELISLENWNGSTGCTAVVGTSTQSSITGTVGVGANPTSFNFSLGGATVTGTASGTVGGLSGAGTGVREVTAAAAGTVGGLNGTANGLRTVLGTAAGAVGGISGQAVGLRTVNGTGTGQIGGITGNADVAGLVEPGNLTPSLSGPQLRPSAAGTRLIATTSGATLTAS